jgi:plasmid stabilization system protein ParE
MIKLRFTVLFEQDLYAAARYIQDVLKNDIAAERLVLDTREAIRARLKSPLVFAPYPSVRKRPLPYYYIQVRNYIVLYVVIGDVMEVRRFIYSRRDINAII